MADKIKLVRPEVAEKYACNLEQDVLVHTKGYSGKISTINLSGADHLYDSRSGYLTKKADSSATTVKPSADMVKL